MIDCQTIVNKILKGIKPNIAKMVVIYEEGDHAANSYMHQLSRTASKVKIQLNIDTYISGQSSSKVLEQINLWNDSEIDGILFCPSRDLLSLSEKIYSNKRVEGNDFDDNVNRVSCTARACIEIIKSVTKIDGSNVLIIGYGKAVGKPLSYLLMREHAASVTLTHKYTPPSELWNQHVNNADIIISATGKPHFIRQDYRSANLIENKILIDAGISIVNGKVVGDVDPELEENNILSPVPGGVGPVTAALLLKNVYLSSQGEF